jgi:hypothetical protein
MGHGTRDMGHGTWDMGHGKSRKDKTKTQEMIIGKHVHLRFANVERVLVIAPIILLLSSILWLTALSESRNRDL